MQESRARFNQYMVNECCPLCGTEAEDRVHFFAVCSRLVDRKSTKFICELVSILSIRNSDASVRSLIKNPQCLTQIILDCSVIADARLLEIDGNMLVKIEKWSRSIRSEVRFLAYLLGNKALDSVQWKEALISQ